MILSLQTDTFGCFGGIPTYNRLVCLALNDCGLGEDNAVFIAMDNQEVVQREFSSHPNLDLAGFGGNRAQFVKAALRAAWRRELKLVLAGHVNYAPLCLALKLIRPRLRFGVFVYGWDVWFKVSRLRRFALRRADFLISISEYTKRQAVSINGLDENRIWVLPNAINDQTHETRNPSSEKLSLEVPDGLKLLSVGRLESSEQQKGFDTVIRSLPAICKQVADLHYLIVGIGTDLERHRNLAREVGVSDRVHFLGTVDAETLRRCYQHADIFVMPSAQEGFGFVYLEAMQYGKPIVAARSGGAPEVVEDGVTGRLVEYGNHEELTGALLDLCLDANKRRELGLAGYQRLQKNFTFARFKQKLSDILLQQLPEKTVITEQFPVGQKIEAP